MPSRQLRLLALPLAFALLSSACFDSETVVTKVKPAEVGGTNGKMNGGFYALPRTVVTASVPLVRKNFFRGKFQQYAGVFFPDDELNSDFAAGETHKMKFGIKPTVFDSRGEP